jgi:cytochrome c551/c552
MKSTLVAVAALFLAIVPAHADDAVALLQKYRCYICHADNEPGAGPAYVDVAAKYRGAPKAASTLAAIIRKGARSGGPWHMPPHPEVSNAEAAKMARYILSLKN